MEEANPIEANDSDYDPNKETKKEVGPDASTPSFHVWQSPPLCPLAFRTRQSRRCRAPRWPWAGESIRPSSTDTISDRAAGLPRACT